jgi:hypothetical protein
MRSNIELLKAAFAAHAENKPIESIFENEEGMNIVKQQLRNIIYELQTIKITKSFSKNSDKIEMMRTEFPYQFRREEDGFILLNRNYNMLGKPRASGVIDYSTFQQFQLYDNETLDKTTAALSKYRNLPCDTSYFYNDGCKPWHSQKFLREYISRLIAFEQLVQ